MTQAGTGGHGSSGSSGCTSGQVKSNYATGVVVQAAGAANAGQPPPKRAHWDNIITKKQEEEQGQKSSSTATKSMVEQKQREEQAAAKGQVEVGVRDGNPAAYSTCFSLRTPWRLAIRPKFKQRVAASMSLFYLGSLIGGAVVGLVMTIQSGGGGETRALSAGRASAMERLWDDHMKFEFAPDSKDVAATMRTMNDHPYVNHVPTQVGGNGSADVALFYEHHFIFANPPMAVTPISRTIGAHQIVDEMVISLNHTQTVDWLAPGVAATGRHLEFPLVAVVRFEGEGKSLRISREHIYWDQATVLFQLGVLSSSGVCKIDPATLDLTGPEQAAKVLDPSSVPFNKLLARTGRLKIPKHHKPHKVDDKKEASKALMGLSGQALRLQLLFEAADDKDGDL